MADGHTVVRSGDLDQAGLHGVLDRIRDLGLDIEGARADVQKIMGANPRRIAKVEVTFTMPPNHFTEKDKSLLEAAALTCPVCKSLSLDCEQAIKFVW